MRKEKKVTDHTKARQCHYCILLNYFVKSSEKMEKHLSCCAGKDGFTFSFDNGKIINYQDHYKNLGDRPFTVYYDFETTTGSIVFFDAKMYVMNYCMIVAFHPELKIARLVIFRENFNKTTLKQLEDAAFSVQNREKNTALTEMFSIELKFTTDCLKFWFEKNQKNLEIDIDFSTEFKQSNPIIKKTTCCLCDFPLEPRAKNGWADHVFKAEHLFLENIYSQKEMVLMKIE